MLYGFIMANGDEGDVKQVKERMRAFGLSEENIFIGNGEEKTLPPGFLNGLSEQDTLVLENMECLGGSLADIRNAWHELTENRKCRIILLDMEIREEGEKTVKQSDPVEAVMADGKSPVPPDGIAVEKAIEYALESILRLEKKERSRRSRQSLGKARANGTRIGRRELERPANFPAVYEAWKRNEISAKEASERLGVNFRTWKRFGRDYEQMILETAEQV